MSSLSAISPTQAIVDLSALAHNLDTVRRRLPRGCDILAVLKADAYGHGALPVAKALAGSRVTRFGVASPAEGIALREAGLTQQILVLGPLFPEQLPQLVAHRLTPAISSTDLISPLTRVLGDRSSPYPVHIKVETGMGRLGLMPDTVLELLGTPEFKGPLTAEGLMTHLSDADNEDERYTKEQIALLQSVLVRTESAGFTIPIVHAANSAAVLAHPSAHLTLVRPGLLLYGYPPASRLSKEVDLKPMLALRTKVAQVRTIQPGGSVSYARTYQATRPTKIAVLPIGYADGYSRGLSNKGSVLIKGQRAPIVGRVCMDMTMVDVTHIANVYAGDSVTVMGEDGTDRITALDLADWLHTIPYEILCGIGPRIPRVYTSSAEPQ